MVSADITKKSGGRLCALLAALVREVEPGQEYAKPRSQAHQMWPTLNSLATLVALSRILAKSCLKPQLLGRRINVWLQLCDHRSVGGAFAFLPIGLPVRRTESSRLGIYPTRSYSIVAASLFPSLTSSSTTMPGQRNPNGGLRKPSAVHSLPL